MDLIESINLNKNNENNNELSIEINSRNRHPWEITKTNFFLNFIISLIKSYRLSLELKDSKDLKELKILDAGAGDAYIDYLINERINQLANEKTGQNPLIKIICWDANYPASFLNKSSERMIFLKNIDDLPDNNFDMIIMLDFLEHIENDVSFLKSFVQKHATSNTTFIISVPAHSYLFTDRDHFLHHFRRYDKKHFQKLLKQAGLEVIDSGSIFFIPYIARLASVLVKKISRWFLLKNKSRPYHPEQDIIWKHGKLVSKIVLLLFNLDVIICYLTRKIFPIPGLSLWALAKRQSK